MLYISFLILYDILSSPSIKSVSEKNDLVKGIEPITFLVLWFDKEWYFFQYQRLIRLIYDSRRLAGLKLD